MQARENSGSRLVDRLIIRKLDAEELEQAESIVRLAFGTYFHVPDPSQNPQNRQAIRHRWARNPEHVLAAELDGELVGTNVLTKWGSFAFFGPLTVKPDLWDSGIGTRLVKSAMNIFDKWGVTLQGLFTFPDSPKHLGLYHKFGFRARFLTPIMAKEVRSPPLKESSHEFTKLSECGAKEKEKNLELCRRLAEELYPGLDLSSEIDLVNDQGLGDTLLLFEDSKKLSAFAICQAGPGTEAGSGVCYVKFGASSNDRDFGKSFESLLSACESFAVQRGANTLEAGVNLSHSRAFDLMLKHGFRSVFHGVTMQKPNRPGFDREENYIMDDWR